MAITVEDVKRISHLAKIKILEEDMLRVHNELNAVFTWLEKLKEINIDNVSLLEEAENKIVEREDKDPLPDQHELVLQNAPNKDHNFFVVPKVVE